MININTMSYDEKMLMLRELIPTYEQLLWFLVLTSLWVGFLLIVINSEKYRDWKEFIKKFF